MNLKYYIVLKGVLPGGKCFNKRKQVTPVQAALKFILKTKMEMLTKIWDAIFEAGKAAGIKQAWNKDTLRLEMGFCLYGNDIDDTHHRWKLV